jgi:hypothetical protein
MDSPQNRYSEMGVIYANGYLFFWVDWGGQRSHDEGNEHSDAEAAKTRVGNLLR